MRLRITVQRHGLPATSILWRVPEHPNPEYYTIAGLLEDLNHVIPLEAPDWGLDDYVVLVGGFECVHFDSVRLLLKDEDELLIRALSTNDIRARRLSGRYQISESGQHLVDGIPFGRPLLRWPRRPQIQIPPRKRPRMLDDPEDVGVSLSTEADNRDEEHDLSARLITSNGGPHMMNASRSSSEDGKADNCQITLSTRTRRNHKSVQFGELPEAEIDSDEDDDEDFEVDNEDSSSDEDDSDDISSGESSPTSSEASVSSSSDEETESDSDTHGAESGDESESSESAGPDILSSKPAAARVSAPGHGQKHTKYRNRRRQDSKKLKQLKASGKLHPDATLEDFRNYVKKSNIGSEQQDAGTARMTDTVQGTAGAIGETTSLTTSNVRKRKHSEKAPISEGTTDTVRSDIHSDLEKRKRELLDQLEQVASPMESSPAESARKRLKPNVAAIGRILGRQTRPLNKRSRADVPVTFEESPTPVDPDFYKSRINVSAFETYHSGYSLGPPPFPFKQHWDPACETMQSIDRADRKKNGKKTKYQNSSYTAAHSAPESALSTSENVDGAVLDYGEASSLDMDTGTAIEDQIRLDVATATTQKADLPALPDQPETLPELSPGDVKPGAIIIFKYLAFDQANPMPELSDFVTGRIEQAEPDHPIHIKLANRDRTKLYKEGKIDKDGNPTFGGVEISISDEEVVLFMEFPFLHEARLLVAPSD
ncbi:uncharacterized protein EI97DRAFT_465889 [Westerdykella ornata]|uniref:DUF7357 domain-containing protein n=1 Tax=Westerdykella ornata TaxID=318751 RepID=A0A6A6JS20_WESOR|nr:uncharacterized protein EI97DRAFT_465889 [Westerdykella ornata]KAF2277759.1 hypothetical protein EI97DRAFT_465889 [Westerdykella ornata]